MMYKITKYSFVVLFSIILTTESVVAKNIIVCFDGTGNHPEQAEKIGEDTTNVYRLCSALTKDESQVVKYMKGVGTSGWKMWDLKGGLYGLGADGIKDEAIKYVNDNYKQGDVLFAFGFSRGAAIARDFANDMHSKPIQMLGIWDTVAAFGISVDILGLPTQSINLGKKLDIPSHVKNVYHLLSIDEKRTPFIPTLVDMKENVEEVWFSGVHADVGGGYDNRRLADISLRFMIDRAKKNILRFDKSKVDVIQTNNEGEGVIHDNQGKFSVVLRAIVVRKNGKASEIKPKIHKSVFARSQNTSYDPENLKALVGKYEVIE